jgi:hypothetical protein
MKQKTKTIIRMGTIYAENAGGSILHIDDDVEADVKVKGIVGKDIGEHGVDMPAGTKFVGDFLHIENLPGNAINVRAIADSLTSSPSADQVRTDIANLESAPEGRKEAIIQGSPWMREILAKIPPGASFAANVATILLVGWTFLNR